MKEDKASWVSFFQWLRGRGLDGVKLVVGDKCLGMLEAVGEKTFLTARMGLIDICPAQEYLASKIIPAYAPCLMNPDKTMELETVPREMGRSALGPQPDWNYLRWDGYTDQKYQAIQIGDCLPKLPWDGKNIFLECQVRSYFNNGNLVLLLQDWNNGEPEPWGDLTVNLGISLDQDCAFVDVNHLGQEILPWLENEGLATPTGCTQQSGFVSYPEPNSTRKSIKAMFPFVTVFTIKVQVCPLHDHFKSVSRCFDARFQYVS